MGREGGVGRGSRGRTQPVALTAVATPSAPAHTHTRTHTKARSTSQAHIDMHRTRENKKEGDKKRKRGGYIGADVWHVHVDAARVVGSRGRGEARRGEVEGGGGQGTDNWATRLRCGMHPTRLASRERCSIRIHLQKKAPEENMKARASKRVRRRTKKRGGKRTGLQEQR